MDWIAALDMFGVFVFALSGGFDAAKYRLDILGIMMLSIATGVGGGIMRDALLGMTPPTAFVDERYFIICLLAGLVVIFFSGRVEKHFEWVRIADAIGLGVFAASGAAIASDFGLGWVGVLMVSGMTATGGGVVRDLLVREVPMVLRSDFYASAALLGGGSYIVARELALEPQLQLIISALVAICARFIAMRFDLSLPKARGANAINRK